MSNAELLAEAIDTLHDLGWALCVWLVLVSAVAGLALYAVVTIAWWVARSVWRGCAGAWRWLQEARRASCGSRVVEVPERPADGRTARPVPSWARTDHHTHKEAA